MAVVVGIGLVFNVAVLAFDLAVPGQYATAILYALPILAAYWCLRPVQPTLVLALAATAFSVLGYAVTPAAAATDPVELAVCRAASLLVLWGMTFMAIRHQKARALAERFTIAELHQAALLEAILDTVPDALIVIDQDGIIQSFSRSAQLLFGYRAEEAIGRNVSFLMPSTQRDGHAGYLKRYLRTGERRIIGVGRVVEARTREGTTIPVELAVGEARVANHHVFIGFVRDLSARQRIEEELRQAHKAEAIGQLTGGVAHDFNNLLTVITGNLELLQLEAGLADNIALKEAIEAAELGAQLTTQLLSFGRRQPLAPREVDVVGLVHELVGLLSRTLGDDIEVEVEVRGTPGHAVIDASQLQNALLNLAINARDAMETGGRLTITIFPAEIDPAYAQSYPEVRLGRYVAIQVADTGTGMTEEVRERAFEPFFTTKTQGSGSGLGLSMVYGFAKQSNGHVEIDSTVGHGTSVTLFLPRQGHAGDRETSPSPQHETDAGNGETILVVEDNPQVRRVAVLRLTNLGYRVLEAASGPEALERLATNPRVDLLFTDVVMGGGMSGFDLAREAHVALPELPVLFTSGYADPEIIAREREDAGEKGNALLRKPYSRDQLAHAVRSVIHPAR